RLETIRGIVPVRLEREDSRLVFGRMEQPIPSIQPYDAESELLAALGVEGSELPVELYDNGMRHVYVALGSEEEVAGLRPDLARLELPPARGALRARRGKAGAGRACRGRCFRRNRRPRRVPAFLIQTGDARDLGQLRLECPPEATAVL